MKDNSYYGMLGIAKTATDDEIKTAFRKLALQYHPDKNPGNPEAEGKFKDIAAAYDVLVDPFRRRSYDLGHDSGRLHNADFFNQSGAAGWGCGGGGGCCGRRRKFGRQGISGAACVVELSPDEARKGTEKEFIMDGPSGFRKFSVAIPPGAENGMIYRIQGPMNGLPVDGFDIHIKIV